MKLTFAHPDETLAEALRRHHAYVSMPCGGRGICGKCAVLVRGALPPVSPREAAALSAATRFAPLGGYAWRMACLCQMLGDCEVLLPQQDTAPATAGFSSPASVQGPSPGLWAAVDLGTTTVSLALYDRPSGALLSTIHEMNRQSAYGADVLSRIDAADRYGVSLLQACTDDQLSGMLKAACEQAAVSLSRVSQMTVTGNTTMLHLLTGRNPHGIGVAPFTPASLFGESARICGIPAYLPRCVSAYVGGDITCGMLATSLCAPGQTRMLVDVGTNGEMALHADGRLLCCATAAGPAFEGAQISMGMPALKGAIDRVTLADGTLYCRTIGDAKPIGICGSGLISALCHMLAVGAMDETGRLLGGPVFELGDSGIRLTQQDIRQVQLAKAAIAAGIDTLLHEAGLPLSAVDVLYLSGGFGSYVNPGEAAQIGLIPAALAATAIPAGNTALSGAAALLFHSALCEESTALAQSAKEVPLATNPYFMDRYLERMSFEAE